MSVKYDVAFSSLTKEYNLPTDFLLEQMSARVGSIIEGFKDETDPKVFFFLYLSIYLSDFQFKDTYQFSFNLLMFWTTPGVYIFLFDPPPHAPNHDG